MQYLNELSGAFLNDFNINNLFVISLDKKNRFIYFLIPTVKHRNDTKLEDKPLLEPS